MGGVWIAVGGMLLGSELVLVNRLTMGPVEGPVVVAQVEKGQSVEVRVGVGRADRVLRGVWRRR